MSGGVALLDFDNDGLLDIYFVDSLTVETAKDPKAARSALYRNLGQRQVRGRHGQGRRGPPGLGRWACARPTWTATAGEDIYVTGLGRELPLPQQPRRHLHRHRGAGRRRGRRLVGGLRLRRLRPGRRPRPLRQPLREDRPRPPPEFGKGQDLRVPRHRRAVRPAGPARRVGLPLPQRRQRALHARWARRPASAIPAGTSAWASPGSTSTTTAGRTSTWPTTPAPNFLYENQKDGTFKEVGLPAWAWR